MNKNVAIKLTNVSKTFKYRETSHDTIREKVRSIFNGKDQFKIINALTNINLEVNKGEFFGIIGHNGSGKSTLLKLMIGAMKPDKGSIIESQGRILRLALGMGFDMNLSARHNIYVNGSIMGLTFKEIGARFHEIIDFAELLDFIDTPLKFYSSGMITRLAFSISVHVDSDILLIDEFFGGVGDESFKEKSELVFKQRILEGKTVVFVSHSMAAIEKYCQRVCVIDHGVLINSGTPSEVIPTYVNSYKR